MPFARILTRFPEDAALISGQLQSLGYTIEIAAPEQPRSNAADLEIDLERCPASAAIARAEELARNAGADVFVAPGSLNTPAPAHRDADNGQKPTVGPLQTPAVHPQPEPPRTEARMSEEPTAQNGEHDSAPKHDFAFLSSYAAGGRINAREGSPKPSAAAGFGTFLRATLHSAEASLADLSRRFAERREQGRAQRQLAREARAQALAERRAQIAAAAAQKRAAAEQEAAARRQRVALLAAQAAQARQEAQARQRAQEEARLRAQAEARVRAQAEMRARAEAEARARAQAEAEARARAQVEAEARVRAAAEAQAHAQAARVQALREQAAHAEAERLAAAKAATVPPSVPAQLIVSRSAAPIASTPLTPSIHIRNIRIRRDLPVVSRLSARDRTLLAAAALAIILMVGWTVALQRQPDLPVTNTTLEQELPFGPVKLVPHQSAKPAVPSAFSPRVGGSPKPALMLPQSSNPAAEHTAAKKASPAIKPHAAPQSVRRRVRPTDAEIADDEVVVHHYGPTGESKTVVSKTGPRHISDID